MLRPGCGKQVIGKTITVIVWALHAFYTIIMKKIDPLVARSPQYLAVFLLVAGITQSKQHGVLDVH
jgi:hypothetical protein